jgi:hypothetical protein
LHIAFLYEQCIISVSSETNERQFGAETMTTREIKRMTPVEMAANVANRQESEREEWAWFLLREAHPMWTEPVLAHRAARMLAYAATL